MNNVTPLSNYRNPECERFRQLLRNLSLEIRCVQRSAPAMTKTAVEQGIAVMPSLLVDEMSASFDTVSDFLQEFGPALNMPKRDAGR